MSADHVMAVSGSSMFLSHLTIRTPVASALDVGTGTGVQALLASRHAERVVGTDPNPRALSFARFNALLNDVPNVEFREGSLFEPVGEERFDLIVSNPPFVVSPDDDYLYRDSGAPGDEISRDVVRGAAEHLAPGGTATVLIGWIENPDVSPWERPTGWAADTGCDVWVLHHSTLQALSYAVPVERPPGAGPRPLPGDGQPVGRALPGGGHRGHRLRRRGAPAPRGPGLAALRRPRRALPGTRGRRARSLAALEDRLAGGLRDRIDARRTAGARPAPPRPVHAAARGRLRGRTGRARPGRGMRFQMPADPLTAELLARCDGRRYASARWSTRCTGTSGSAAGRGRVRPGRPRRRRDPAAQGVPDARGVSGFRWRRVPETWYQSARGLGEATVNDQPSNDARTRERVRRTAARRVLPAGVPGRRRGLTGVALSGVWKSAPALASEGTAAPAATGATGGLRFLEIDGVVVGTVKSVSGGEAYADVVPDPPQGDAIVHKHIGGVKYEDFTVQVGMGMSKPFTSGSRPRSTTRPRETARSLPATSTSTPSRRTVRERADHRGRVPGPGRGVEGRRVHDDQVPPEITRHKVSSGKVSGKPSNQKMWLPRTSGSRSAPCRQQGFEDRFVHGQAELRRVRRAARGSSRPASSTRTSPSRSRSPRPGRSGSTTSSSRGTQATTWSSPAAGGADARPVDGAPRDGPAPRRDLRARPEAPEPNALGVRRFIVELYCEEMTFEFKPSAT